MSDEPTPRTDAFLQREHVAHDGMWIDFARELERENARLRAALTALREKWLADLSTYPDTSEGMIASAAVLLCARELNAVRAEFSAP